MEIAHKWLEGLACNWTGGTLPHLLLNGIAGNFEKGEPNGPFSEALFFWNKYDDFVKSPRTDFLRFHQVLVNEGVIPSDYVFLVGTSA